jgi:hypothetical protein
LSGTVRNLVSSGKLLKNGKYMPNISVSVYHDGSVVLTDHGSTYDGDMRNLVTFCKESQATYVAQGLPKPKAPDIPKPLVPVVEVPVKAPDHGPVQVGEPTEARKQTPLGVILDGVARGRSPVKAVDPPIMAGPVKEPVKIPTSHTGIDQYTAFSDKTSAIHYELIRAVIAGVTPDNDKIGRLMRERGEAEPAYDKPIRVVKRGGTLEELFEKYRNVPDEQLFTEDVENLFENKIEGGIQLARATEWSVLIAQLYPT